MRKILLLIAVVAMLLPGCKKIEESIDALENRIEVLENETIPTIDEQIAAINLSLDALEKADEDLNGYIRDLEAVAADLQEQINDTNTKIDEVKTALQNEISTAKAEVLAELKALETELKNELSQINATIETLKAKDAELDQKIADLKSYVDTELGKTTDWVNATFATLEQLNTLSSEVAIIKALVDVNKTEAATNLANAISALETSLKSWVGEQLAGYYTIAEIDAMLATMEQEMNGKLEAQKAYLESLINELSEQLTKNIADNKELIDALREDLSSAQDEIATNKLAIANNSEQISKNATKITANAQSIAENSADIDGNSQKIKENKSLIEANETLINNNKSAITSLQANVDTATKAIAKNAEDIAKNAALISANATAIGNNAQAIADNATEIANLKTSLATTKQEITNAYKTAIEEAISTNNGVINSKIANEVATINTRINNEVAAINATIKSLTERIKSIESEISSIKQEIAEILGDITDIKEDVSALLARIQSVSYIPTYDDGKATVKYVGTKESSEVILDFKVSPKECVAELANVWKKAVKVESIYTQTRAVSFVDMPVQYFEADEATGVITIVASGKNLSDNFFAGTQSASVALAISDGNNSVTTDYIPMVAQEVTNEIWYTSTDGNIVTPYATDVFGANIVSNIYKNGKGVILFDAPITLIGQKAFLRCSSLTRIEIPSSVTSIGAYAFGYCTKLMSLTIPDSVTSIGNRAFYGCTILKTTTIPNSVIEIGDRAFYACRNFQSVTIPNSVTKIGTAAFSLCSSTKAFYGKFASTDNRCLIVNGTLNSFAPCGLTEYTIPDGITEIGALSFPYCTHLQSVTIPDSITSIGEKAFLNCTSLIEVYCAAPIPPKGDSHMFSYFDADDNLYHIGCKIYVPALSVDTYKATAGWKDYADYIEADISITDKIYYTTTDNNIISKTWSSDTFGANITSHTYTNGIGIIEFDAPVTKIYGAFDMCYTLKNIAIPSSVTSITEFAFSKCSSLASINIPNSVTEIGTYAFNECTSLTNITIPDSVTALGEGAFCGASLTSVTIPNRVSSIGVGAFAGCSSLTSFYGKFASSDNRCLIVDSKLNSFAYKGITKYTIPDSVTSIGRDAFSLIDTPIEITIPQSVTSIESQAFWCCSALQIYCESTIPAKLHTIAFAKQNDGSSGNTDGPLVVAVINGCPIYVPAESVEAYKTADGWKEYADYIEEKEF